MQSERIYSAPSLFDIIKQLLIYRSTGVLTLWRATASHQDHVKILVEHGHPRRVFWGATYQEDINETILGWLNAWGELHFSFLATELRLQLPAPTQKTRPAEQAAPPPQPTSPTTSQEPPRRSAVTRPLPAVPPRQRNANTSFGQTGPLPENGSTTTNNQRPKQTSPTYPAQALQRPTEQPSSINSYNSLATPSPETVVAAHTANGRTIPPTNLPRYERTIFLLVDGRRTAKDLAQLTKRSFGEIYATLSYLQSMQLITIATVPRLRNA